MPDTIRSTHATLQEHLKRSEASYSQDLFAKAIAEGKNPAAVYLSSLGASKGGKNRAIKLSAKRRSEIAQMGGKNRWKGKI